MPDPRPPRLLAAAALGAVVVGTLLVSGPDRATRGTASAGTTDRGPATVRELCDAYVAATRADDNFLADSTPGNQEALRASLEVLVDVGTRAELTSPQRAGLALVADGIATASGVDVAPLPLDPAAAEIPFARASTALARFLDARCEAQLARPAPREGTGPS